MTTPILNITSYPPSHPNGGVEIIDPDKVEGSLDPTDHALQSENSFLAFLKPKFQDVIFLFNLVQIYKTKACKDISCA